MSEIGTIYGCIFGMGNGAPHLYQLNQTAIGALPERADWVKSFIQRDIFTVPMPSNENISFYRMQMIHFGLSKNHLVDYWGDWLLAFEALLRQLYWYEAHIHMRAEMAGRHDYHWKADFKVAWADPPRPIQEWEFEGGPRSFR